MNLDNVQQAKAILKRVAIRPEPSEVGGLDFGELDLAAQELNYPVYEIGKFLEIHRRSLVLFEDKIRRLMGDHEKSKPNYIIFGRDGAMVYDAMRSLFPRGEISKRINMVVVSKPQADYIEGLAQFPKKQKEFVLNMEMYLAQAGLKKESFKEEGNFVFVDSGYMGSMFDFILRIMGTNRKEVKERVVGYLFCRSEKSFYKELSWVEGPKDEKFFADFYSTFGKDWEEVKSSVVGMKDLESWGLDRKTNWALANYLQIQPKYHRRTLMIEKDGEVFRSLPSLEDRVYPLKNKHFLEPENVGQKVEHPAHSSAIDPVVATKLQIETVRYFSRDAVRDRVLGETVYY